MWKLNPNQPLPAWAVRQENAFSLMIYEHERQHDHVDGLLLTLALRARQIDQFEINEQHVRHLGDHMRVLWCNEEWCIEDFLSMVVDVRQERARMQHNLDARNDPDIHTIDRERTPWVQQALDDPWIDTDFLARFLFWTALRYDTRVERLCCKTNNMLDHLGLGWPQTTKILAVRRALAPLLASYVKGYLTRADFDDGVRRAYECGETTITEPDSVGDFGDESLFDAKRSVFGQEDIELGSYVLVIKARRRMRHASDDKDEPDVGEAYHELLV